MFSLTNKANKIWRRIWIFTAISVSVVVTVTFLEFLINVFCLLICLIADFWNNSCVILSAFSLSAIEILTTTTIAACNAAWIDSAAFVSVVVTCTSAESTISIYSSEIWSILSVCIASSKKFVFLLNE